MNDIPAAERQTGGLRGLLRKVGWTPETVSSLRDYAKAKPGVVLGGLAAVVIGASLMRRAMR